MRHPEQKLLLLLGFWAFVQPDSIVAQRLPQGTYRGNRERTIDIVHYKADLRFDFKTRAVSGRATVRLRPLSQTTEFSLDAIQLNVNKVELAKSGTPLDFEVLDRQLHVTLGREYAPQETLTVEVDYTCQPNAGLYFQPDPGQSGQYLIHTYGEGGLHANWLPIYNDVNDKFPTEMIVTVPQPYAVISNGELLEVQLQASGEQSFHWQQTLPHPNYLISIYVGEFEKGELPAAFGKIPLSYWVPKGRLQEGAFAFRNTTKMVEFFSELFNYTYPWDKYDQIAVPDYAIGAMEHTGVTGHRAALLRNADAPFDFEPNFSRVHNVWTDDGIIAHELAHHWFGNNLTCRNLSFIWLNESFASYLQMLWAEESLGENQLHMDRQVALDRYLDFVATEHMIRPLEYRYFDSPDVIYNEQHTYLKGAIVLHMLREILGDDHFFGALSHYLHKHEFANVESSNLSTALEEVTGKHLNWFFDDWVYGGGHPIFEVSYNYLPSRKLVELTIKQVQPILDGQDFFTLPVEVTLATASGVRKEIVWVENDVDHFLLECDGEPVMVSFDGKGALVAEIRFAKAVDELVYQSKHDQMPGRIWAVRELARRFPIHPKSLQAISKIVSEDEFWGLQAEATFQLGAIRTAAAGQAMKTVLKSSDYRVRKAAALALPKFGTLSAAKILKDLIRKDPHNDVVATAIVALARANDEGAADFIRKQLGRASWYDEITIACLEAFQIIGAAELASDIKPFTSQKYNQGVRISALSAWKSCSPEDSDLQKVLMANAERSPYSVQQLAIEMLGELYVTEAVSLLERVASESGDENISLRAEQALEKIQRVTGDGELTRSR